MADNTNNPNFITEEQVQEMEDKGRWASVTDPQVIEPSAPPPGAPPYPHGADPYGTGPLPQNFGYQPALVKTSYPSSTGPIGLFPIQSIAAANAKSQGVAKTIAEEVVATIPKTVIPASTPTLTDYSYPGLSWMRDDFRSGTNSSGNIGEMKWFDTISSAGANPSYGTGTPPHLGELWIPVSTSLNQGHSYVLPSGAAATQAYLSSWDLLNNPGWKCTFVWRWMRSAAQTAPVFTNKSMYLGLCMYDTTALPVRPCIFIGARFDTDTTSPSIGDTTINLEVVVNNLGSSRNNIQGTVINTTLAPTEDVYYRLDIECTAIGQVSMSINGGIATTFIVPMSTLVLPNTNQASASNGEGQYVMNSGTGGEGPWACGTLVNISNMTGSAAVFNGNHILFSNGNDETRITFPSTASFVANTAATVSGYPSLTPFLTWANNSTSGSYAQDTFLAWDFFGFDWDPFTFDSTAPTATLSRFFGTS